MSAAPHVSRAELVEKARRFPARSFTLFGAVLAVLGGAAFLWTLAVGEAGRAWQSWHVNFMFWTGLAQGMVVFAATQKLAKGHWSGLVIRLAEAGAGFPRLARLLLFWPLMGRAPIFTWLHRSPPPPGRPP